MDIQDIATATGKSNSRPVPPALSEVLDNLTRTLEGLDLSKVTGLDTVKADLKQSAFGKVVGANWTLAHIAKNLNHFKQFDNLIFESVEKIDDVTGQAIRRVDVKGVDNLPNGLKQETLYEFKSVIKAPPTSFKEQFVKDLKTDGVKNLSQIKWIFDGKKLNALDKDAFVDELEKVKNALDDPRVFELFKEYNNDLDIRTAEKLIEVMKSNNEWFSEVFKVE